MLSRICCLASLLILASASPAFGQESAEAATLPPVEVTEVIEVVPEETLCPSEAVIAQTAAVEEATKEALEMEASLEEILQLVAARQGVEVN